MLEITDIQEQKKDVNRVSVFINGKYEFGISVKEAKRYGLHIGNRFTEEEYKNLLERIQLEKAKFKALDYISYQNRSEKEVINKLISLEYSQQVVEEVIRFLKKYEYINDEDFAKKFTEYGLEYKKKSVKRLQYELYQKGITDLDLNILLPNKDELEKENVKYLLKKYKYNSLLDKKEKDKIVRRILAKGFSYGIIREYMYKIDESFDD